MESEETDAGERAGDLAITLGDRVCDLPGLVRRQSYVVQQLSTDRYGSGIPSVVRHRSLGMEEEIV